MDLIQPSRMYPNILLFGHYLGIVFSTFWHDDETNLGSMYLVDRDPDGKLRFEALENEDILSTICDEGHLWPGDDTIGFLDLTSNPVSSHVLGAFEPAYSDNYDNDWGSFEDDDEEADEDEWGDDYDDTPDGSFYPEDDDDLIDAIEHILARQESDDPDD